MRALVAVVVVACGHPAPVTPSAPTDMPWAASGIDWSKPPALAAAARFVPPPIIPFALSNGVRVVVVENHRLPIVAITALELAAGSREDGAQPGLAALTADLLDEGAGVHDRAALADELEHHGARLDVDIATDYAAVRVSTPADQVDAVLGLVADVVRHPRLADADVARVRTDRVAELAQHRERPRVIAAQVFDQLAFGAHPYAQPADGVAAVVGALTAADVRAFHHRAYGVSTTVLVLAGDVDPNRARTAIEQAFGAWQDVATPAAQPKLPLFAPAFAYVDVPGATTTAVMIGRRAPRIVEIAAEVANHALGGPGARLDRKLRGELGVATGAGSSFWSGAWAGTWGIATNLHTANTADGLRAALAEVDAVRTKPLPIAELEASRTALVYANARAFETTTAAARAVERLVVRGLPYDMYRQRADALAAVTPASARDAAFALWSDPAIVVVGDWAAIGKSLRAVGLPLVHYDADARPVP